MYVRGEGSVDVSIVLVVMGWGGREGMAYEGIGDGVGGWAWM